MDEPLSNLDAKLRVHMRAEIASLQHDLGVTTIYVTHDQVEAMTMGDRVAVMRKGEIQQVAPPQELYERPVNLFVGGFIGSPAMNLVEATHRARNGRLAVQLGEHVARRSATSPRSRARRSRRTSASKSSSASARRTSRTRRSSPSTRRTSGCEGVVVLREPLGSEIVAHFTVAAPPALTEDVRELARDVGQESAVQAAAAEGATSRCMVGRFGPRSRIKNGDVVDVAVETTRLHFFDLETGLGVYAQDRQANLKTESNDGEGAQDEKTMARVRAARRRARVRSRGLRRRRRRRQGAEGSEDVSGEISIMAIWAGEEQESFEAVIAGFKELYPNVDVKYTSGGDNLGAAALDRGRGRQSARHRRDRPARPDGGLCRAGRLQPLDDLRDAIVENFGESVADVGAVDGTQYGLHVQGRQQVDHLVQRRGLRGGRCRASRGLGKA